MISDDSIQLDKILNELLQLIKGIRYITIVDKSGLLIKGVSQNKIDNHDFLNKLATIGNALFLAADDLDFNDEFGPLSIQITEYGSAYLFSCALENGVMIIAADKSVNLTYILNTLKKYSLAINKVVQNYFCPDQGQLNDDLRNLFLSELK
jgi:predicted regulator of Ras-like GTPase activity (Roadblock/LC7/MglB family)